MDLSKTRLRRFRQVAVWPLWRVRTVSGRHDFVLNAANADHAIRKAGRAMAGNKVRSPVVHSGSVVEFSGYQFEVPQKLT